MVADVSGQVGVHKVLARAGKARNRSGKLPPVLRAIDVHKGKLIYPRFGGDPAQGQKPASFSFNYGTVARDPLRKDIWLGSLDSNRFGFKMCLLQLSLEKIASGLRIEALLVEVLHVEAEVGDSPGDALVVTDYYAGNSGQGDAADIQAGRFQMHHVPSGGHSEIQMRVIGENRFAAGGELAGDGPGIGAGLHFAAAAGREELIDESGVAVLEQSGFFEIVLPGCGEVAIHLQAGENGVDRTPRSGLVTQQRKL